MLKTTSRGALTPEEKKEKVAKGREFHAELLDANGARPVDFNFKSQFQHDRVKVVGIFPSEFLKENGFYLELIDSNLDPIDSSRTVYRVPYRPNYEDVYPLLSAGTYAYPLEELEVVEKVKKVANKEFKVDMSSLDAVKDDNISTMTITDFAAIMWMKPVSEKGWLNNLINQNI